jgi:hypothetical protein
MKCVEYVGQTLCIGGKVAGIDGWNSRCFQALLVLQGICTWVEE